MKIEFSPAQDVAALDGALAILAFEGGQLSGPAEALDVSTAGGVRRAIAASRFAG